MRVAWIEVLYLNEAIEKRYPFSVGDVIEAKIVSRGDQLIALSLDEDNYWTLYSDLWVNPEFHEFRIVTPLELLARQT